MVKISILASLVFAALAVAAPGDGGNGDSGHEGGGHEGGGQQGGGHEGGEYEYSSSSVSASTITTTDDSSTSTTTTTTTTTDDATTVTSPTTMTSVTTMTSMTTMSTMTTMTTTSTAPILVASPFAATFDDIAVLPGTTLQPVGLYDNVFFQGLNLVNEGNFLNNVDGVQPQSRPNAVSYNLQVQGGGARRLRRQNATPALIAGKMGSTAQYLSLANFYFGCAVSTTNATAAVAVACTLQVTGFVNGTQVAQQTFSFSPSGSPSPMVPAAVGSGFSTVDTVSFATQGSNSSSTAILLDSFVYTTYSSS